LESKRILLIEDNPADIELTRRALVKTNVTSGLTVIEDGVEALKYFYGDDGKSGCPIKELPVLVLLDLNLPRINGLEVLRRMRAEDKTRYIPVVILSSSNEEKDIMESYGFGANSFVRKPTRFTEFVEAISELKLYWLRLNLTAPTIIRN